MLRKANMARYRSKRGSVREVSEERRGSIWEAGDVEGRGKDEGGAGSTDVNCLEYIIVR